MSSNDKSIKSNQVFVNLKDDEDKSKELIEAEAELECNIETAEDTFAEDKTSPFEKFMKSKKNKNKNMNNTPHAKFNSKPHMNGKSKSNFRMTRRGQ